MKEDLAKKYDELLSVKNRKFEISQRLTNIVEVKDVPYIDYMLNLLEDNLQSMFNHLSIFGSVPTSQACSKQRGEGINITKSVN